MGRTGQAAVLAGVASAAMAAGLGGCGAATVRPLPTVATAASLQVVAETATLATPSDPGTMQSAAADPAPDAAAPAVEPDADPGPPAPTPVGPAVAPPATTAAPPAPAPVAAPQVPAGSGADVRDAGVHRFACSDDEATVAASGAARVTLGSASVYVGTAQVSADNQDPRVARFDGGSRTWCREDLETSGDDQRGYGVLWSGATLLVVISGGGTQGEPSGDLRRFTTGGWLTSYTDASPGGGGGAKAAAIVRLDPATGDGTGGTWLTSLNGRKTNSLVVTGLGLDGDSVVVTADSWFQPRRADRSAMTCTGSSPFKAGYTFTADLSTVTRAAADGCS